MVETANIDHRLITPYHPRANGVAERFVQTMVQAIRKRLQGTKKEWDLYVPALQFAINCKVAAIHGSTPFSLMFGRQFNSLQDYQSTQVKLLTHQELKNRVDHLTRIVFPSISAKTNAVQKKVGDKFNKRTHAEDDLFPDGSYVMTVDVTRRNKLDPRYEGPYKVI